MADPITQDEAKECLDALLELDDGLSDWEIEFIENMTKWEGDFRKRQKKKIVEIYDREC